MLGSVSWLLPLGQWLMESTRWSMCNVLLLSRPILSSYCLLRPWFVCLLAVTYGDSLTTSQAVVPLERIHAFYWKMGPFTTKAPLGISYENQNGCHICFDEVKVEFL